VFTADRIRRGIAYCGLALAGLWTVTTLQSLARDGGARRTPPNQVLSGWRNYSVPGEWRGPVEAELIVVVFSDYECGVCREVEKRLTALQWRFPGRLAIITRHLPMPTHPHADDAARAAVCAAWQGAFGAFHARLFADTVALSRTNLMRAAQLSGVSDTASFHRCIDEERTRDRVEVDLQAADRLGAYMTPAILVGPNLYVGLPWDLEQIIEQQLLGRGS